jgi:hypothetical protein
MVVRAKLTRCLLLLLVVGLAVQAAALAAHHPTFRIVKSAPNGDDPGDRHDPSTCNLCQILSEVRAQAPPAAPLALAIVALACTALAPAAPPAPSLPELCASAPRAPPSHSLS